MQPDWLSLDQQHVWHPFTQAQTAAAVRPIARAEGAYLYTSDGQTILDAISSWWVTLHGHAHPHIAQAIALQANTLEQVIFAGFSHEPAARLSAELCRLTGLQRVFFSDNGSSSVEVALKMALQYWQNQAQARPKILALAGGYHGDTFGAMAAGKASGFYGPFEDKLFEVNFLPCPHTWLQDPQQAKKEALALQWLDDYLAQHGPQTAAFICEPLVQGASGMRMYSPAFLDAVLARLKAYGILVIFDEVMTGFGRTGTLFAAEQLQHQPDLMCLSKGLTAGFLPMAVTLCTEDIYNAFLGADFSRAFAHGHSFTANPLGCAAALASLELSQQTHSQRQYIQQAQQALIPQWQNHPKLQHARLCGTIAAVDLCNFGAYGSQSSLQLREFFLDKGILLRPLGEVVYILPPLCITTAELERVYQAVLALFD